MNKEEKEAIDILQNCIADYVIGEYCEKCGDKLICEDRNEDCYFQQAIDTVVNLIQKQEKIIDKFSKALVNCVGTCPIDYNDDFENENDCENCNDTLEKCWIEYFKKEVENVKD